MKKLKVGIIGTGMAFERLHYPAFQQLSEYYEIKALCDINQIKVKNWAQRLNLQEENTFEQWENMVESIDLDIIDIMVPIELNYEITKGVAAKLSGQRKGIISEKPLAPDMSQAQAAKDLAEKYQLPIMIAENYRYNEEIDRIRDLVRTKKVGDVIYFIQNRTDDFLTKMKKNTFQAKEWRQHPEYPGGSLTDTALHDLAGLRHIFGAIDQLHAFGRPQDNDFSPYSVFNVNIRFQSGVIGQFTFYAAGKEIQRPLIGLRIFGTEGMIYLEEKTAGILNVFFNDGNSEQIPFQPEKGYYNELLNFHKTLTGSEKISVTPEIEYGDLLTVNAILQSLKTGAVVNVDKEDKSVTQAEINRNSSDVFNTPFIQ